MPFLNSEDILAFVSGAVPGFKSTGAIKALSGGNLNYVWRVFGEGQSLIVKQAPPYIAKAPDIPLSSQRILIEAAALRLFDQHPLHGIISDDLRPPRLLYTDEKKHALILEDVGELESLDNHEVFGQSLGTNLGTFIGKLHRFTFQNEAIAEAIDNRQIQQSRLEVQYTQIRQLLNDFGISNWAELGDKAEKLGEKYLTKGKCLIMGDLWPRSILIGPKEDQARIIDWEFAHFGRPAQDVAHFLAHLWMLQHRAGSSDKKTADRQLQGTFVRGYLAALGPKKPLLFDEEEIKDAGIHFGAEILARTLGSFQSGYLYEGLRHDDSKIKEAVNVAARYIGAPMEGLTSFTNGGS
ncbi:MAG: phosphotransferase [Phaeodactylibacter sp.]|nr:phosphotransferase [Phaeodactylibacter sp.]